MKKRTLKQEFIYLASGESISVVLFCIVYVLYTKPETRFATSSAVLYFPLLILNLILLQGSIYWLNCLRRIQKKKALETQLLAPLYKGLKMLDFIMLLAYIPIWIWSFRVSSSSKIIIGVLLWLFAIIEFVNGWPRTASDEASQVIIDGKSSQITDCKRNLLIRKKYGA